MPTARAMIISVTFMVMVWFTVTNGASENSDIVLNEARPEVFYCPTKVYADKEKKILTALPISKLCQYGVTGKRPPTAISDCLNDADENPIACDEKKRFLKRIKIRQDAENLINGVNNA